MRKCACMAALSLVYKVLKNENWHFLQRIMDFFSQVKTFIIIFFSFQLLL